VANFVGEAANLWDAVLHYKKTFPHFSLDSVLIATNYTNTKHLIERYKYASEKHLAEKIAQLLLPLFNQVEKESISLIIPVPMHWTHYIHRSFHHTEFLVKILSEKLQIPSHSVLKTSTLFRQSHLSREKRLHNHTWKITLRMNLPEHVETVILVDDVISTGATAHECWLVLKRHGVKKVVWIFLASNL
jgi:ComF family protein